MSIGLLAYGAYLPVYRLGPDSGVRGTRIVASFDEDATTMAVAAARSLRGVENAERLWLTTSSPAYLDRTNAVAAHAALGLGSRVEAIDAVGTARTTAGVLRAAASLGGLVLSADVRVGLTGSADERAGADVGAGLLFGEGEVIADLLGTATRTAEFLDRWREPGKATGEQWEERFGFERYAELVREVAAEALDVAGLAEADHVILTSSNSAVAKRAGSLVKGAVSTQASPVGFSGASDLLVALSGVLDVAAPGETILAISAADGADAFVLRVTDALVTRRQPRPLDQQIRAGRTVPYVTYLNWRGLLDREMPRRPEPDRPAGPPSARAVAWKFGLVGSRCTVCEQVHLPPLRICRYCSSVDAMAPAPVADRTGTVATYTVDRLAFSPSPPVVQVVVDIDGGGRTTFEVADALPNELVVGTRVELCFRRLFTAGGVANYFWKARQIAGAEDES